MKPEDLLPFSSYPTSILSQMNPLHKLTPYLLIAAVTVKVKESL
jgi:hypothetical protein